MTNIIVYVPRVLPILQFIPHSNYYHHGEVGVSCFRVLPFLIFSLKSTSTSKIKLLVALFITLTIVIVYLSGSRTGLIGVVLIFMLYLRNIKTALLFGAILIVTYQVVSEKSESEFANERYERLIDAFQSGQPRSLEEVDFRLKHFEMSLEVFKNKPFFGNGYDSWLQIRSQSSNLLGSNLSAHSAYSTLIGETGIFGILLFIFLMISHLKGLPIRDKTDINEMFCFMALIGIIPFLLMGINSSSFWHRVFVIYLGIASGAKARNLVLRHQRGIKTRESCSISA